MSANKVVDQSRRLFEKKGDQDVRRIEVVDRSFFFTQKGKMCDPWPHVTGSAGKVQATKPHQLLQQARSPLVAFRVVSGSWQVKRKTMRFQSEVSFEEIYEFYSRVCCRVL